MTPRSNSSRKTLFQLRQALLSAAFGLPVAFYAQSALAQDTAAPAVESPAPEAPVVESPPANTAEGLQALIAELEAQLAVVSAAGGDVAPLTEQIATLRTQLAELTAEETSPESEPAPETTLEADAPQAPVVDTTEQPAEEAVAEPLEETPPAAKEAAEAAPQVEGAAEQQRAAIVDDESGAPAADVPAETQPTEQASEAAPVAPADTAQPAVSDASAPETAQQPEAGESPPANAARTEPTVDAATGEITAPAAVANEDAEQAVQEAEQTPTAVVSDEASAEQLQALEQAETQRREDARADRAKLLGAGIAGVAVGAILNEALGGGRVVADEGDRVYIERNGEIVVQRDENALIRDDGSRVETLNLDNGIVRETVFRQNGSSVITERDRDTGEIIYRSRIRPDGQEVVLIDNRAFADLAPQERFLELPETIERRPLSDIIIEAEQARQEDLARALEQERIKGLERAFDLRTVRQNQEVRDLVKRIDLSNVQFASGSFAVREAEVRKLGALANAMANNIDNDPSTLFLIEGHTDAVGGELYNLDLSDRRAETVARILIRAYGIPAENLITQGYGERYLKVNTQEASQTNRRVTVRNISPLVAAR